MIASKEHKNTTGTSPLNIKKLRVLKVAFDTTIQPWEIPAFRGAIAEKVGLEHEWFHNHKNTTQKPFDRGLLIKGTNEDNPDKAIFYNTGYHYRYPKIQYKTRNFKNQLQPLLVCIGDCVEEAHKFFSQADWTITIRDRKHNLQIARMEVDQFNLRVYDQDFHYNLFSWQALNPENYRQFQNMDSLSERIQFLETLLKNHILAFAKGVDWWIDQPVVVKITNLRREKFMSFKRNKVQCFDLSIKTNVFLPEYLGIGKGVSKGFGTIRKQLKANKYA